MGMKWERLRTVLGMSREHAWKVFGNEKFKKFD
jgi:hypothetical protein